MTVFLVSTNLDEESDLLAIKSFNFRLGFSSLSISGLEISIDPSSARETGSVNLFISLLGFLIEYPLKVFSFVTGSFESGNISPFGSLINSSADVDEPSSPVLVASNLSSEHESGTPYPGFGAILRNCVFNGETFDFFEVCIFENKNIEGILDAIGSC